MNAWKVNWKWIEFFTNFCSHSIFLIFLIRKNKHYSFIIHSQLFHFSLSHYLICDQNCYQHCCQNCFQKSFWKLDFCYWFHCHFLISQIKNLEVRTSSVNYIMSRTIHWHFIKLFFRRYVFLMTSQIQLSLLHQNFILTVIE
jgi:hypothetical protein